MKSDSHDLGLDASDANYTLLREVKYEMVYASRSVCALQRWNGAVQSPPYQRAVKAVIIDEAPPQSKVRVIFANVAMGMGVDVPSIWHVIHVGPPRTIREYFQETGQAGQDGCFSLAPGGGKMRYPENEVVAHQGILPWFFQMLTFEYELCNYLNPIKNNKQWCFVLSMIKVLLVVQFYPWLNIVCRNI